MSDPDNYDEFIDKSRERFRHLVAQRKRIAGQMHPANEIREPASPAAEGASLSSEPVGDVFYELIRKLGYHVPCSACDSTRKKMNQLGVAGCREHFDDLVAEVQRNVARLQQAGRLQRTPWTDAKAAAAAIRHGIEIDLANPIAGVLRTAIARVESEK